MAQEEGKIHPQTHLTKHLTGGSSEVIRERTRINSAEEQDYLNWQEFLSKTLGVDFYKHAAQIYMGLKISKDGLSRQEDVEAIKGLSEQQRRFNTGLQITELGEAMEKQRDEEEIGR